VIAEETKRLGEATERLTAGPGIDVHGWAAADISARDLLSAVAARPGGPRTRIDEAAEDVWFTVDSFAVADALSSVVRLLDERHGVPEVVLAAGVSGGELGRVDLSWAGSPLRAGELERDAGDAAAVVRRHGGELWADANHPLVRVLLPRAPAEPRPAAPAPAAEPPPALYDFELERFQPDPATWSEWEASRLDRLTYTVFDTETTGFDPDGGDEIVSIGAVRIVGGRLLRTETFERLVDPGRGIPRTATAVHGITRDLVRGAPPLDEVLPAFAAFAAGSVLVGHNVAFDMAFLAAAQRRTGTALAAPLLDTLLIDGVVHPDHDAHTLEAMAERLGVDLVGRHTALGDALLTGEIFLRLLPLLGSRGVQTLGELRAAASATAQARTSQRLYRS
jgi:DNA polymerase III subunit epsilon